MQLHLILHILYYTYLECIDRYIHIHIYVYVYTLCIYNGRRSALEERKIVRQRVDSAHDTAAYTAHDSFPLYRPCTVYNYIYGLYVASIKHIASVTIDITAYCAYI